MVQRPSLRFHERATEIVEALLSVGPVEHTALGDQPVSWQTLHYWQRETELYLEPGELEDIVDLSFCYLAAADEYRDKVVASPYTQGDDFDRKVVHNGLKRALDSLVSSSKRKPAANVRINKR